MVRIFAGLPHEILSTAHYWEFHCRFLAPRYKEWWVYKRVPCDISYRNSPDFCYTGSEEACIITKRGEALSPKGKDHLANTEEKGNGEPRHDDLLWKDLLTRFFVPMLRSLLPDLARDIDDKRDVLFLDKELRRLARFTRHYERGRAGREPLC